MSHGYSTRTQRATRTFTIHKLVLAATLFVFAQRHPGRSSQNG